MVNFVETQREIYSTPLRLPKGEGKTILLRLKKKREKRKKEKKIFFFFRNLFLPTENSKTALSQNVKLGMDKKCEFCFV